VTDRSRLPRGTRCVQELLDAEDPARHVPAALRDHALVDAGGPVDRAGYLSRAVHELEGARVWRRTWQMACRLDQIPEVGDSVVYDVAGASLVVVRTAAHAPGGAVRAFHNSCLHRGTQLRSQPGRIEALRCPFHGFTWNLDGTFAGMPCPWDFPHVDAERFCLPEARVDTWGGFVFVNLDPACGALAEFLELLPRHFEAWPLEDRVTAAHVQRVLPCNWKVALEAFIESYHTVAVHPQLLTSSGDAQTQYDVWPGVRHVSRMITPVGVASEHVAGEVGEQDIVDAMFLTRDDPDAVVPVGGTARRLLADRTRAQLAARTGRDMSAVTDCEALDAIEYFVFPNLMPWAGYTTPLTYRFRPNDDDHRTCLMDVMLLEPAPASGPRPAASPTRRLEDGQRWADAPELGYLGRILDQDSATLRRVQRGLEGSVAPTVTLAVEQESRIRHFHATLDAYLAADDDGRGGAGG